MGQLMLKGIPLYLDAYTMKLPGVSTVYALFMMFLGQTIAGIHLGLLIVNGICIFLTYLLACRLIGREAAIIAAASYAVLSLSYSVLGVFAHATHFVVVFSLLGFVLLFRYIDRGHKVTLFLSALCFGSAFIMKQHAALLASFAFLYLAWRSWRNFNSSKYRLMVGCAIFLSGMIVPYSLIILYVFIAGALNEFWFWTVQYAREYVSEITLAQGWDYFCHNFEAMAVSQLPFWLMAGVGGFFLCTKRTSDADKVFIFGFFLFSLLAVCPGWYFRPHYFVMLLPAVALMAGAVAHPSGYLFSSIKSVTIQHLILTILLIIAAVYACYREKDYYFFHTPRQVSRAIYALSPFPEALLVARYIKDHTSLNDRIAILGSEPEIFFYADRLSATKHIYMYGLMENQRYATEMQQEIIRDIQMTKPKYLVIVNVVSSWVSSTVNSGTLVDWAERYAAEYYDVVGVIDIFDYDTTDYHWDEGAKGYKPIADDFLTVLKRKEGI
jgi:hypothetical protein